MIPSIFMGLLTNLYIGGLLTYLEVYQALFSPIIGAIVFTACYFLLKKQLISTKLCFLIVAYTVLIEIAIHSYYMGWGTGFYYFIFLLPTVFLLNTTWKISTIVLFNLSVVIVSIALRYYLYGHLGVIQIETNLIAYINLFNISSTGSIVIVIMIYFSRTINQKDQALIEANNELELQNKEIFDQHKKLQLLIKEIHHRVKNNLQIISSLMSLQEHAIADKEVIAVLNESKRRVEAIALIHQKLYQDDNMYQVDFESYLEEIMGSQQVMNTQIECKVISEKIMLDLDTAVPLGLIISELITNAVKHAFKGIEHPKLIVTLKRQEDLCELIVEDNGAGLPVEFDIQTTISLGF